MVGYLFIDRLNQYVFCMFRSNNKQLAINGNADILGSRLKFTHFFLHTSQPLIQCAFVNVNPSAHPTKISSRCAPLLDESNSLTSYEGNRFSGILQSVLQF